MNGVERIMLRVGPSSRMLIFFFQAEDGIRYSSVIGVQTCALPIFSSYSAASDVGSATCPVVDKVLVRQVALPTSLAAEYEEISRQNPPGYRYAADNMWTNAGVDDVLPALRDAFTTLPTEKSFSFWYSMAPQRQLPDMALSLQADLYYAAYVVWEDEADDEMCRAWLATQMHRMEPISEGLYLGDSHLPTRPSKVLSDSHSD